ncbi:MAG: rRNA maturation RNase YbeY [Saprospiraceae bacterium]|nr:rRNA maturation RNase YbeY [Saprospiraceae bacterium]
MQFPELPSEAQADPSVSFHFEAVEFDLPDPASLGLWLQQIASLEGKPMLGLDVIFCSDEYLRQVNREHLQHDYYTDIITFPYTEGAVHGDLFVSSERVAENAQTHRQPFVRELCRVLAHGVLHLAGYGDKSDQEISTMRAKEEHYLLLCPALES